MVDPFEITLKISPEAMARVTEAFAKIKDIASNIRPIIDEILPLTRPIIDDLLPPIRGIGDPAIDMPYQALRDMRKSIYLKNGRSHESDASDTLAYHEPIQHHRQLQPYQRQMCPCQTCGRVRARRLEEDLGEVAVETGHLSYSSYLWSQYGGAVVLRSTARTSENPFQAMVDFSQQTDRPTACIGCRNYCGETHGGNKLICGIHPYGADDEKCSDFEPGDALPY